MFGVKLRFTSFDSGHQVLKMEKALVGRLPVL